MHLYLYYCGSMVQYSVVHVLSLNLCLCLLVLVKSVNWAYFKYNHDQDDKGLDIVLES
jgi:hypothetical protein